MYIREIPNKIGKLIHLRYLNFSWSFFIELPEGVCELHNLQYLNLSSCHYLKKLPEGIGKLINLRSLNTWRCDSLEYYPKAIGSLTSLRELTSIKARVDCNDAKEFSVGDLENLDLLCGFLQIRVVGNMVDAKRAKLHKKKHLNQVFIKGSGEEDRDDVIKALNHPCINIQRYCL